MTEKFANDFHPSSEAGQASPFVILLAALLGVLILAVICIAGVLLFRGSDQAGVDATSTAIAEANATTLAQNAQVTQTIAAMETEAAQPTNTPTLTPSPTATTEPTETPGPTETPVVQEADGTVTVTPNAFGTSIFDGGTAATATAIPGDGDGTLPDTGVGVGVALAAAVGLLLLLIAARRLRTG